MANRILRDWTDSETVDKLSPNAEVLFTRLFMKADDYGSFHANPKLVKSILFPLKDNIREADITRWMNEIQKAGLIFFYEVADKKFLRVKNFGQRLRNMRNLFPVPLADNSPQLAASGRESPPETKRNETILKGSQTLPFSSDDFFESKVKAFEDIRDDDLYIEDCIKILSGRGWTSSDAFDVIGLLKYFSSSKLDLDKPKKEIRQHFKNWLSSGNTKLNDLVTKAEVFKKQLVA